MKPRIECLLPLVAFGLFSAAPVSAQTTATWSLAGDGAWSTGANWSGGVAPINGQPLATDTYNAVLNTNRIITLDTTATIEALTQSNGTITGANSLTLNGLYSWGGTATTTLSGGGINVQANGGITLSNTGVKVLNAATLSNAGTANWTGGTFRMQNAAVFNNQLGTTFDTNFNGTFDDAGTGGVFNNAGTFTKSGGTGTTIVEPLIAFNNTGTVNVNTGTLSLTGGGTHTGAFNVASGATMSFSGGTHALNAGTTVSGSGTLTFGANVMANVAINHAGAVTISGGTYTSGSTTTVGGLLTLSGGTIAGTGPVNASGGLSLSGGNRTLDGITLNNNGAATWSAGALLTLANGAVFNNAAGSTFTVTLFGAVVSGGVAGGSFNNAGTLNITSGSLRLTGGGTHTGAFDIASGTTLELTGGTHTLNAGASFSGTGTFYMNNAAVTVTANVPITHSGTFTLGGGTLNGPATVTINGPMTWTDGIISGAGVLQVNGGLTINTIFGKTLDGRTLNNAGTASHSGLNFLMTNGAVINNQAGATFNLDSDADLGASAGGSFNNAGTLNKSNGAGTSSVTGIAFSNIGTVNVSSGTLSFDTGSSIAQHVGTTLTGGTWNVTNGATLTFNLGSNITTNQGSVTLDGAGSTFARFTTALNDNQGSFTLKNNRDLTTVGAFANSGTMRVEDSTTVMTIGAGGGSAYTQTGGVTFLAGGAMIDASAFNLNDGTLAGTGTVDAPLMTGGVFSTIAPGASPGILTINGSTILGGANTLAMEVGGLASGVDYDLLDVNGVLTLGGLLDVDFINSFEGSVLPTDTFTIATANSAILGAFSNVTSGGWIGTNTFANFQVWYGAGSPYGDNNLVLTGAPEPSRAILFGLGLGMAALRRNRQRTHSSR